MIKGMIKQLPCGRCPPAPCEALGTDGMGTGRCRHAMRWALAAPAPGLPSTSHPLVGVRRLESTADLKPLAGGRQTGHDPPPA
jgi:hypothetical protein